MQIKKYKILYFITIILLESGVTFTTGTEITTLRRVTRTEPLSFHPTAIVTTPSLSPPWTTITSEDFRLNTVQVSMLEDDCSKKPECYLIIKKCFLRLKKESCFFYENS
jgi:hypothetical protein